jgi:hypothetical protein
VAPTDCEIEILDIEADIDARKSEPMTDEPTTGRRSRGVRFLEKACAKIGNVGMSHGYKQ